MPETTRRQGSGVHRTDDIVRELRDAVIIASHPDAPVSGERLVPTNPFIATQSYRPEPPPERRSPFANLRTLAPWLAGAAFVILGLLYVSQYGLRVRATVVREGSAAIAHMVTAKEHADRFAWAAALEEFSRAQEGFETAGRELDAFGPSVLNLLSHIPGLGSLRAGTDIIEAGTLLSRAGASMADVLSDLSDEQRRAAGADELPMGDLLASLDTRLMQASTDVDRAIGLLNGVDADVVPEEQREAFIAMRARLGDGRGLLDRSREAVGFFRTFLGADRPRRYLVLFQNSSELRPTGGFPGTYGILTVRDGAVADWRADDIYNPDGQIADLIVPPVQLQHITPGWGMRDANWFADFPTSARKVAAFWQHGGGAAVDGVLAISPNVLEAVLEAVGPVRLDDDTEITAENFLATLQLEVEQSRPSGAPKQVIADLAPLLLDRLAALPPERWLPLAERLSDALARRDLLMSFTDGGLMAYADAHGWTGRVLPAADDYLMVVVANVKGAKTDAVTDTALKLETRTEGGQVIHRLTLTRRNDGDSSPYGFYNKPNYAFIRVLVPKGSTLRGLAGNDRPTITPMIDYVAQGALRDADLEALEATYRTDVRWGATVSEESGKTGFGFWMTTQPGETAQVQVEYALPANATGVPYRLFVQRQPGLEVSNLEVTLEKPSFEVVSSRPDMTEWPDSWRVNDPLDYDFTLETKLR